VVLFSESYPGREMNPDCWDGISASNPSDHPDSLISSKSPGYYTKENLSKLGTSNEHNVMPYKNQS